MLSSRKINVALWRECCDSLTDLKDMVTTHPYVEDPDTAMMLFEVFIKNVFERGVSFYVNYNNGQIESLKHRHSHFETMDALLEKNTLVTYCDNYMDFDITDVSEMFGINPSEGQSWLPDYDILEDVLLDIDRYLMDLHRCMLDSLLNLNLFEVSDREVHYRVSRVDINMSLEFFDVCFIKEEY